MIIIEKVSILKQTNKLLLQMYNFRFLSKELSAFLLQTPTTKQGQDLDYKCQFLPHASQKLMFYRVLPLHSYLIVILFKNFGCDLNFKLSHCVFQNLDF